MSVPAVQSRAVEQVPPVVRTAGPDGSAPSTSGTAPSAPVQPEDRVIVSEQARRLSAVEAGSLGDTGGAAEGEVALKLDFRKLRELVTAS